MFFADANPEFLFKLKLDEEAKGLTNRPLTLYTRINLPGAKVKWSKGGEEIDVSFICIVHRGTQSYKKNDKIVHLEEQLQFFSFS